MYYCTYKLVWGEGYIQLHALFIALSVVKRLARQTYFYTVRTVVDVRHCYTSVHIDVRQYVLGYYEV
jgi:hypothetical protein